MHVCTIIIRSTGNASIATYVCTYLHNYELRRCTLFYQHVLFCALCFLNSKNYNSEDTQGEGKDEYVLVK